jgi:hypothetical protein
MVWISSGSFRLPTGFLCAGNQSFVTHVAETNPADFEFSIDGPRAAAQLTAPFGTTAEFRFLVRLGNFGFTGHGFSFFDPETLSFRGANF